uniref:Uncharacterized protein n=1 Tax=Amphimedon queenslandica TaxID=400682 RepID=A0A1X7UN43_AMPQE
MLHHVSIDSSVNLLYIYWQAYSDVCHTSCTYTTNLSTVIIKLIEMQCTKGAMIL